MSKRLNPHKRKHAHAAREVLLELVTDRTVPRLVVEDPEAARALHATHWSRFCRGDEPGTPWPAAGDYQEATVRLQRSKPALEMALHAAASALKPGGTLWLYGANDEGIRSAPKLLAGLFEVVDDTAKKHSRVYQTRRTEAPARASLSAWRAEIAAPAGLTGQWVTYPGAFARGGLDAGTAALLEVLPTPNDGARVLDFACGVGVISAWLHARQPEASYDLLDADVISLLAAGENCPWGTPIASDAWSSAPDTRYDMVVSNPPFHDGKDEDFTVLKALVAGAPKAMRAHATLWIICQRQVPLAELFVDSVLRAEVVSTGARFSVWKAYR